MLPTSSLRLTCLSVVLAWSFVARAGLRAEDPPGVKQRLEQATKLLERGKTDRAVQALRDLLADHPESRAAVSGRELLAERGYGRRTQIVLHEAESFERFGLSAAEIVATVDRLETRLGVFFRQTYPERVEREFLVLVHDSRPRFLAARSEAMRRSVRSSDGVGPSNLRRERIDVFFDATLGSAEDARGILFENIAREIAGALTTAHARRPLPEALEIGLAEYLALRLFPRKLSGVPQTLESLTQARARRGLGRLSEGRQFLEFLSGEGVPDGISRRVHSTWVAQCYALIDVLLHARLSGKAEQGNEGSGQKTPEVLRNEPRNFALQAFFRDYELVGPESDLAPRRRPRAQLEVLQKLLKRHFEIDLAAFHKAYLLRVQGYPPEDIDFDLYREL